MQDKENTRVRYSYGLTSALLVGGAALTLVTGFPAGAQVAQNDEGQMARVVPRAGAPESFADLTAQLQPAVVNIATRQRVEVQNNPFAGTPFAELFNRRGGGGGEAQPQTREAQSLGSGFIISADGIVVTNNHVISPPDTRAKLEAITVTLADGTEYEADVIGADAASACRLTYTGSVDEANAVEYASLEDVEGFVVGRAGLDAVRLRSIILTLANSSSE